MFEPRGHKDMYGAILLPPYNDYADMTVLFMHNEGYSTMCGHGVIAITTGLIEEGLYPGDEPVTTIRYEVPAGIVAANAATVRLPTARGPCAACASLTCLRTLPRSHCLSARTASSCTAWPRSTARWVSTSPLVAPTTASSTPPRLGCASCPSRPTSCAA